VSGNSMQPAEIAGQSSGGQRWREGIAIVGMSARFPGCRSVDEYWSKLATGESLLSEAADEDMRAAGVDPDSADAAHFVRSGTRLEDAERFDAKFFDFSRREAEIMDPQQRIFLECAYEALEHAGISGEGERTGVFAGIGMNTYLLQLLGNPEVLAAAGGYQMMLGNDKDFLATRVAYKLNLRGPAVVVQTACSTSLAAVHLACQSLLAGECDSALAGGVSVMFPQLAGYPYVPGMILSPDGFCRPFDERARGTVPGKGAGLVVLKRLSDAEQAGDTIYAVIAGSAWNNDGSSKVGYTAPSVEGQVEVIRAAQWAAGVSADRIGYVEAHGTGTELGDPIEVAALAEAFGTRPKGAARCVLGSVKANMGHADVAAGVAGLIKAALAVYNGVIPPTPHFERANPALGIEQTPFLVSAERQVWPGGEDVRWAGVSSFGIGGTNVHLCLRSVAEAEAGSKPGPWVFPLSAKTARALEVSCARLADFVEANAGLSLASAAFTLQSGRRTYPHRRAVVAGGREELIAALRKPAKGLPIEPGANSGASQVVFLFPGQGQQFAGMAEWLYRRDARFREQVDRGLALLSEAMAEAILAAISDGGAADRAVGTSLAQPLLFLTEYALAMCWMELGVAPKALVGHSLGELTAAAVAGVFSFEDGLRLAVERGALMEACPEGAMLAVSLPVDAVGEYLTGDLWIAAENGPRLTVISGSPDAVKVAEERLAGARVATVRLKTDRAFHTPHMAEAATRFQAAVAAVERDAPRLPWLSNVTGTWITAEEATSPQYWGDQITSRVRFAENGAALAGGGRYFLLEVGPGDALTALVRQHDKKISGVSSLGGPNRRGDDLDAFLGAAAAIWERGMDIRWEKLPGFSDAQPRRIALPTYPFERERFWVEATHAPGGMRQASAKNGGAAPELAALEKRSDVASWFYAPAWQRTPRAQLVLPRRSEPVTIWVVLVDDREEIGGFGCRLAEALELIGVRVLRLQPPVSQEGSRETAAVRRETAAVTREMLDQFWKEHRDILEAGPVGLMNCWTLRGGVASPFESMLLVLQTAQAARVRFAQIEVIADELVEVNGEITEEPKRGLAEGIARIVSAEFTGVALRVIDPGVLDEAGQRRATTLVLAEVGTVAPAGLTVAFRGQTRWQSAWQPVRLESVGSSRFRAGGTYVITGGMGGIGFVLARYLLEKYGAKVALVGRTVLPHRERWEEWLTEHGPTDRTSLRIQRAKELEALGGEFLMLSADVGARAAMDEVWEAVERKFGPVHGVIHAAGLPGGARIAAQDMASAEEVLRPKAEGSQVLAAILTGAILTGKPIDFLLFCSSISSVVPVAGAAAYAAANAFQDRYATWCRQHLGLPAVAINFDAWQEVGMAAERAPVAGFEDLHEARLRTAMTSSEGLEVIERALMSGETRLLVSTIDFQAAIRAALSGMDAARPASALSLGGDRNGSGEDGVAASAETEAVLAIWREVLGAEKVGPADNFFELGGHSLLGTMVLARIRERFGVELTIRAIFEAPTPESLASRIREAGPAEPEAQSVGAVGEREDFEF
jgi:phthiocerol/phenolphthiocerol synthesis type-I polyketide synthase E